MNFGNNLSKPGNPFLNQEAKKVPSFLLGPRTAQIEESKVAPKSFFAQRKEQTLKHVSPNDLDFEESFMDIGGFMNATDDYGSSNDNENPKTKKTFAIDHDVEDQIIQKNQIVP